jgi:hypothetical protein
MELTLNLAWMVLAMLMFWLWLHHAPRDGESRRTQLLALAVVILIMFPVISVTDDLLTAQSPAETDCCQRKAHACSNALSSTPHMVADLALPVFAEFSFGHQRIAPLGNLPAPLVKIPAMGSIQNRPPPAV